MVQKRIVSILIIIFLYGCIKINISPTASLSVSPSSSGNIPFYVTFQIDGHDMDGYVIYWSLDINSDENPEFVGTGSELPKTINYTFTVAGNFTAKLIVIDNEGLSSYATVKIKVFGHANLTIASWNLQVFGVTKASNETLLNYYADKINDYDICIIQEIRDVTGTAIQKLASKLLGYNYILSERAGTTQSKEQYAIFYNEKVNLISYYDYTSEKQNEFERPPLKAKFRASNWTFTIYTIHTKPDNVYQELGNLENLIGNPEEDTIILGDLNADGNYYDENNIVHFVSWRWVITNDMDTTVVESNNTYDRIIINQYAENNFINAGVMKDVTKEQSDHYLVYAAFNPILP